MNGMSTLKQGNCLTTFAACGWKAPKLNTNKTDENKRLHFVGNGQRW
jgi:hypothetical protein